MKTYLITGCAGFIGSNFVYYMLDKYPEIRLVNLDKLTYAGNLENLKDCEGDPRHIFVQGDICDKELAHSFRYDLLAQGGQRPGMEMYRKFRGADPDKKPMLRARGLLKEEPVVEQEAAEVEATETLEAINAPMQPVKPGMTPKKVPAAPLKPTIKK